MLQRKYLESGCLIRKFHEVFIIIASGESHRVIVSNSVRIVSMSSLLSWFIFGLIFSDILPSGWDLSGMIRCLVLFFGGSLVTRDWSIGAISSALG